MASKETTAERALARIAGRAHGIATRGEALAAGLSSNQIHQRLSSGALWPTGYRGVYRVGHQAPSLAADYMAAVKACGDGAELCGMAAAYFLGLSRRGKPPPPEVSCRRQRRIAGLRTSWRRRGPRPESTVHRGIPVTTPAQTIVDLAGQLSEEALARLCHEAGVKYGTTPGQVKRILGRRPRIPGAAKLHRILDGKSKVTLSYLERRFVSLLRKEGLPLPETNRVTDGRRLDCRWPAFRLTVELDSYRFHNSRRAWEQDRRREREAYARGDEFRRYTYGDVIEHPAPMLSELRGLLSRLPS